MDVLHPPISENPEENLKLAAEINSYTVLKASVKLADHINDPNLTFKQTLEIGEFAYKLSGMAKKQEVKEDQTVVIFNIAPPGGTPISIEKTVIDANAPLTIDQAAEISANLLASGEVPEEAWV